MPELSEQAAEYTGVVAAAVVDNSGCIAAAAGCWAGAVGNSDCPVDEAVGRGVGSAVGRGPVDAPPVDSAERAKCAT